MAGGFDGDNVRAFGPGEGEFGLDVEGAWAGSGEARPLAASADDGLIEESAGWGGWGGFGEPEPDGGVGRAEVVDEAAGGDGGDEVGGELVRAEEKDGAGVGARLRKESDFVVGEGDAGIGEGETGVGGSERAEGGDDDGEARVVGGWGGGEAFEPVAWEGEESGGRGRGGGRGCEDEECGGAQQRRRHGKGG